MHGPLMQEWFYREIQRAFREGVSPDVLLNILSKFLVIALTIVTVFAIWRYWVLLRFHFMRLLNSRIHAEERRKIAEFLQERRIVIGVYLVGSKSRQYLGNAVLTQFAKGRLVLRLTSDVPSMMQRVVQGRQIICFMKPFRVGGKRVNSFTTYILGAKSIDGLIRAVRAYEPEDFTAIPRRRHVRLRIRRSGGIRLKIWSEDKKARLLMTAPDFETVDGTAEANAWKATAEPLDISPGGMKIQVRPQRGSPNLRVLDEIVLELQILEPVRKVFHSFLLLAVVRNIMRPGGGATIAGVQFSALGERVASRVVTWKPVGHEVEPLQDLLETMRERKTTQEQASDSAQS